MSEKIEYASYVMTAPARIVFHNLIDKLAARPGYREQWDLTLEMAADHPDLLPIKRLVVAEFKKAAPNINVQEKSNWLQPWETGEEFIAKPKAKEYDNEYLRGKVLFKSHSVKFPPRLSLMKGGEIVDYEGDSRPLARDKFYAGAEVVAEFTVAYHQVGSNKPGVTLYLNHVLANGKGEKRGGGARDARETFGAYIGRVSAEDPTAGASEEINY